MDGHQYEQKCAQYLREQGYTNVTVTRGSGDQGVDITAMKDGKKYAIQCKYYEGNVGNKAIQEVYAGAAFYNCSVAMVITNSFFTKSAKELAKKLKVILVEDINAIKMMESSKNAKTKEASKPAKKVPSEEERLEKRYQDTVKRFPGNPKLDSEILQYIAEKQSLIDSIICQYEEERSSVTSRSGILFGKSSAAYRDSDNPQKAVEEKYMRKLQSAIHSIDSYSVQCYNAGISEDSAKRLADLIINSSKKAAKCNFFYASTTKLLDFSSTWSRIKECLPSELEGPDGTKIRKKIAFQKDMVRLQQEQINELIQRIDKRETTLSVLTSEINQQKRETASIKKEMQDIQLSQNAELTPLTRQLEIINGQLQQATEERNKLEQERKSLSILAFKQKNALHNQIEAYVAKIDSLKAEAHSYEQQKADIVDKYSKQSEALQSAMNAAELKRQQTVVQMQELQEDIREHISEQQLEQRKRELQNMLRTINDLEVQIKKLRFCHMISITYRHTKFANFDKLFEQNNKIR